MFDLSPIMFDDLVRIMSRAKRPTAEQEVAMIAPGQVWHLQWDGVSEIGAIAEADDRWPKLVPLTFDAKLGDNSVYVPSFTSEAVPLWRYARQVPAIALASLLGACHLAPQTEPHSQEDDIQNSMDTLSNIVVAGDGSGELSSRLKDKAMPVSQLAKELNEDRSTILDLLRGGSVPNEALAGRLAAFLEISVAAVHAGRASLPQGLRDALTARGVRYRVKSLAGLRKVSDSQAWVDSAYGVLAMPYRSAGDGDQNWESRVDRFYEVNL